MKTSTLIDVIIRDVTVVANYSMLQFSTKNLFKNNSPDFEATRANHIEGFFFNRGNQLQNSLHRTFSRSLSLRGISLWNIMTVMACQQGLLIFQTPGPIPLCFAICYSD